MKGKNRVQGAIEKPVLEVVLRSEDTELAVVSFFADGAGGYDVLVGVIDTAERDNIAATFNACADAVVKSAFRPLRTTHASRMDNTPPF